MKTFSEFLEAKGGVLKAHVTAHLRTLPHVVGKYDSDTREWQIKHRGDRTGDTTYFTDDHQDAMDTASDMNRRLAEKQSKV
jgi:hypothetical protein